MARRWLGTITRWTVAAITLATAIAWQGSRWYGYEISTRSMYIAELDAGCLRLILPKTTVAPDTGPPIRMRRIMQPRTHPFRWGYMHVPTVLVDDYQVPLWIPLAALVPINLALWLAATRARSRRNQSECPACGYPRQGLAPDAACPECGKARA